jgi:uncharacterized iron-regulated protein
MRIKNSQQGDRELEEFCFTCKEYDQKKHCCPRFNRVIRNALKDAEPKPCLDAVSRADVLETYADLYDVFEDNKQISKELHKVYDRLNALPSAEPKLASKLQ